MMKYCKLVGFRINGKLYRDNTAFKTQNDFIDYMLQKCFHIGINDYERFVYLKIYARFENGLFLLSGKMCGFLHDDALISLKGKRLNK